MARLDSTVGSADYNDVFAAATPSAHVATIELAQSQGTLARGTVVSGTPGAAMSVVAAALAVTASGSDSITVSSPAVYVLAEDVDTGTTSPVQAIAYKSGNFRRSALAFDDYSPTAADWDYMRRCGILTTDSID